jgi:hypothetical protein
MSPENSVKRTLSILQQMAEGKILTLPDGYQWGMSEDMVIGPLVPMPENPAELGVSTFCEVNLSVFNAILDRYEIGYIIP